MTLKKNLNLPRTKEDFVFNTVYVLRLIGRVDKYLQRDDLFHFLVRFTFIILKFRNQITEVNSRHDDNFRQKNPSIIL